MSLVSYCNSKGCLKQASTSKPGPLATAGSCYSSSAHWLPCAAQAAPRRSCQCPGVRRIECLTRCSSSMAAESSTTAAQLPRECPAEATTAAETPSKATESVYDKPTAMAAGTAAASLPQITLTPLQPLNGGSVSQGSMGEWRDAAVDQGYIIHQQQRQQQQQQQQRQQPKHKAAQKSTRNNITTPAAEQQSEQKAATKHTPVGRLRKHKWILSTGDRLARQTGQQKRILAGQQQQRQHWWQSTGKGGALTANLTAQRTAPGLLHLLQTAWSRRTRVNIIHLAAACRSLVDIQQQQGKGVYSSSAQEELLQMMETLLTEQLAGAATAAAAGSVQKSDAGSGKSTTAVEATGTSGTQPAAAAAAAADVAGPSAADAVSALRSLSTLVYSWAKLQHKPSTEVMQLLLDAFLVMLDLQQQQQLQDVQHQQSLRSSCEPEGDQQLHQQQGSSLTPAMDDLKHSSSGHVLDISSNTPSSSSRSSRWMHSLSNLCWGLAKIGYNCNVIYGSSSKSSYGSSAKTHQQQQQLDLQQQYWSRLAAAVTDGVSPASYTAAAAAAASISARDLSSLCYSFAAGGYKDVVLWGMLSSHVITSVNDFQPQELSSVLWAYATAGMRHKGVFAAAAPAACQLLPGFSPQGLVNTLWAYQTALGHVPADLIAATVTECIRRSNSSSSSSNGLVAFGPMHLSMLVWACGKNQVKSTTLASAVCDAAAQLIDDFQAQDLCRLLHGLNVLQPVNNNLFDAAELKMLSFLESGKCNVQTMVQGVGAYAKINHPGAVTLLLPLLQLAEEHVTFLIRSGDATARLLKTLAALRYRADGFVNVLAQKLLAAAADTAADNATAAAAAAVNHLTRWDTRALAITAAGIAKLGHSEQTVLLKVIMQEFNARLQAAAAAAAASSSRGRKDSKVPVTRSMLAHCALLLWCAAVCDMRQDMPLLLPLAAAMQQADASQFSYRSLAQLVQVHMWAETLGPTSKTLISTLPKPLMDQALSWWQIELVPATVRSTFHNEVLAELTAMRLRPVTEGVTPDGMFSVDCIVRFKGCEVALEVMGDQHYSVNEIVVTHQDASQQQQQRRRRQRQQRQVLADAAVDAKPKHVLLGPDALRMRLLAARGYAVAAVSSFEWEGVRDRGKGQALLRRKLEEAVRSHRAAAGLAAAGDQQQQHRRSHGTQGQQQVNHKTSKLLSSCSEGSRQQQQQGGNVDVVQQVAHVLQQQGRSATLVKGKLKRQQYWQQRRDRDKEGMMLLTMAAPWVAAKNQSGSSNSSGAGRGHNEESTFADSAGSADVASGSSSSSGDGSSPVGGTAVSVISDEEFDMTLDLEELLLE